MGGLQTTDHLVCFESSSFLSAFCSNFSLLLLLTGSVTNPGSTKRIRHVQKSKLVSHAIDEERRSSHDLFLFRSNDPKWNIHAYSSGKYFSIANFYPAYPCRNITWVCWNGLATLRIFICNDLHKLKNPLLEKETLVCFLCFLVFVLFLSQLFQKAVK